MAKRGKEVSIDKVDLKENSIRLKQGESIKIILFGLEDYFEYDSHNDFANKIYPQPCLLENNINEECPYCVASQNGLEDLKIKKRIMFAVYSIPQKKLMFWDATAGQGAKLIKQINGYSEDIEYGSVFEFSREGTGKDTSYTLALVSERKYTKADKEAIAYCKDKGALTDTELFSALQPKSRKLSICLLNNIGFDVRAYFDDADAILSEQDTDTPTDIETGESSTKPNF